LASRLDGSRLANQDKKRRLKSVVGIVRIAEETATQELSHQSGPCRLLRGVLAWGAILFGGIQFFRGMLQSSGR
jgi:hypothetical protein